MVPVLVAFRCVLALNIYPTTWGMRGAADITIAPNAIFADFTISCSRDARKKYLTVTETQLLLSFCQERNYNKKLPRSKKLLPVLYVCWFSFARDKL